MFLVALVPLAGFWLVDNVRVQRALRANAEQNLRDASSTLAAGVEGWIDANVRALRQNASLPDVASVQLERQPPVLATMPATYDWLYSAFVINGNGFISARGDDEPILNEDGSYLEGRGDREYYLEATEGNTVGEQTIISSRTGEPAMCMSSPISRDQNVVGVLATCSFLDSVAEAVVNARVGETGFAVLVDDKNNVIAHGNLNLNELEDPLNLGDYPVLAYTQETAPGSSKRRCVRSWRKVGRSVHEGAAPNPFGSSPLKPAAALADAGRARDQHHFWAYPRICVYVRAGRGSVRADHREAIRRRCAVRRRPERRLGVKPVFL